MPNLRRRLQDQSEAHSGNHQGTRKTGKQATIKRRRASPRFLRIPKALTSHPDFSSQRALRASSANSALSPFFLLSFLVHYLCSNSVAAPVMAFTPVRIAGSGSGANSLECGPGSRVPFSCASFHLAGSGAPSQNIVIGGFGSSSANKQKSSLAIIGWPGHTFSLPRDFSAQPPPASSAPDR